jgi:hypothetical protein
MTGRRVVSADRLYEEERKIEEGEGEVELRLKNDVKHF